MGLVTPRHDHTDVRLECASGMLWFPQWNGEPGAIIAVGALAAVVWILLAIPVLVAGLARFGRREGHATTSGGTRGSVSGSRVWR